VALAAGVEQVREKLSMHVLQSLQRTGIDVPDHLGADELGLAAAPDDLPGGNR